MIGNNVLLDTNIISALLQGDTGIADKMNKARRVFIPVVVIGELYYGASYSTHTDKNIKNIKKITDVMKY